MKGANSMSVFKDGIIDYEENHRDELVEQFLEKYYLEYGKFVQEKFTNYYYNQDEYYKDMQEGR
jgi:uncharacterized protein (DUF2164 family)